MQLSDIQPGDRLKVVAQEHGHGFDIGQIIEVVALFPTGSPPHFSAKGVDGVDKDLTRYVASTEVERVGKPHADVLAAAQKAQDAANGDSNDDEIDLLREALELALQALGLELPEGRDQ